MSKPILFTNFHPGRHGWECVTVQGITDANYNEDCVFHADGTLQIFLQCLRYDCMSGTKFFTTWKAAPTTIRDLAERLNVSVGRAHQLTKAP